MRFGSLVPQGWRVDLAGIDVERHWEIMSGLAQSLEDAGFDSVWVNDHFHTVPTPTQQVTYEAWTLMAAFAVTTRRVRLGQMCTAVGYRNPAYLAKMAACVDVISAGRVEMGIGAGWYEHEYRGYGYAFLGAGERIAQLDEATQIMRLMWSEPSVDFDGDHFRLQGAICSPRGIQDHIPIWIAGGGERKTLAVAAKHADYTNFGRHIDEFRHKDNVLRRHCAEVGRDESEIVRSSNFFVFCANTEAEARRRRDATVDRIRSISGVGANDPMVRNWVSLAGSPQMILDHLAVWKEAGVGYAIMGFPDLAYDTSSMNLFATEVIPHLR